MSRRYILSERRIDALATKYARLFNEGRRQGEAAIAARKPAHPRREAASATVPAPAIAAPDGYEDEQIELL